MSGYLQGCVWYLSELTTSEKAVLAAMADHADDDGSNCYPSVDRLAWKVSMTDRGVRKIVARLIEMGFVERKINAAGSPDGSTPAHLRTNDYKLNIPNRVPERGAMPWKEGGRPWENRPSDGDGEREEPPFRPGSPGETPTDGYPQGGTVVPGGAEPGFRGGGNRGSAKTSFEPASQPSVCDGKLFDSATVPAKRATTTATAKVKTRGRAFGATNDVDPDRHRGSKPAQPTGRTDTDPTNTLARWAASILFPSLAFDDPTALPDQQWRSLWFGPTSRLLRCRSEAEIREAVEFVSTHTRHWKGECRSVNALFNAWIEHPEWGFERDLVNWRANRAEGHAAPQRVTMDALQAAFDDILARWRRARRELTPEARAAAWARELAEVDPVFVEPSKALDQVARKQGTDDQAWRAFKDCFYAANKAVAA